MLIGTAIGLPALRMRGLYLALITLMLAGAITVILATVNFPNGGGGFTGYDGNSVHIPPIRRPSIAGTDPAYFRFAVVVALVMFALVSWPTCGPGPGRAWAAIRQSEPAALAAGINTTFYKLWAFALASFITGVAGAVLAGQSHYLYSINFTTQDSIILLAVALMGGVLQHVGRGDRRAADAAAARDPAERRGVLRLAHHRVRHRRAPGAHHRAERASPISSPRT